MKSLFFKSCKFLNLFLEQIFTLVPKIIMSQSGVTVEKAGSPFTVVADLPRSKPGPKQALVKSVHVALNPV